MSGVKGMFGHPIMQKMHKNGDSKIAAECICCMYPLNVSECIYQYLVVCTFAQVFCQELKPQRNLCPFQQFSLHLVATHLTWWWRLYILFLPRHHGSHASVLVTERFLYFCKDYYSHSPKSNACLRLLPCTKMNENLHAPQTWTFFWYFKGLTHVTQKEKKIALAPDWCRDMKFSTHIYHDKIHKKSLGPTH